MEVRFSRHARRRANLYKISESTVLGILQEGELAPGIHEIVRSVEGMKFPLKLVVAVEHDIITVVTNYPLRKGRQP
jgi:hypothetical protein